MSVRTANTLLAVVGASTALGVLYLAGCFSSKESASAAAIQLRAETRAAQVSCHGSPDGWDYTCRVAYRDGTVMTVNVTVNSHEITDQTAP